MSAVLIVAIIVSRAVLWINIRIVPKLIFVHVLNAAIRTDLCEGILCAQEKGRRVLEAQGAIIADRERTPSRPVC